MKKILLLLSIILLSSCDFKDKNGNAPLIEDANGNLIDNPNYKTKAESEYDEKMQDVREKYKESKTDDGTLNLSTSEPTIKDRESFAENFKPKNAKTEVKLSGKEKTTITLTSAFTTEYTLEQYENLNYFEVLKNLGFKKVVFSNGNKTIATKKL
ncbi:hypothetical protein SAMN05660477_03166 [Soonwooa buanensis]|uniref:Uncharacterized protein n=1 Tax=Soonwooa buanensis TaxID=619805 RepID=A0A1T5GVL2_9FLAO|nr:hypothetical protein [Soonwooa buanensis]SKC12463.1 hypothetical protein SAMN05660477_03166 [Soonwooa buanensis]